MNDDDDDDLKPKDQRKVRQVSFPVPSLSLHRIFFRLPLLLFYIERRSLTMERICALVLGREAAVVGGGPLGRDYKSAAQRMLLGRWCDSANRVLIIPLEVKM